MSTKKMLRAQKELSKILGPVSFGEMIQSFRLTNDYTQVAFANKLGISKQDLCNIEKGRKLVSVDRAKSFAETLKMSTVMFAKYALQDQLRLAGIQGVVEIKYVA